MNILVGSYGGVPTNVVEVVDDVAERVVDLMGGGRGKLAHGREAIRLRHRGVGDGLEPSHL